MSAVTRHNMCAVKHKSFCSVKFLVFLLFSGLASAATIATSEKEIADSGAVMHSEPSLGEACISHCSLHSNTRCINGTCVCKPHHQVKLWHTKQCVRASLFGEKCIHHLQCQHRVQHTECREDGHDYKECVCQHQYEMKDIQGLHVSKLCYPTLDRIRADMPTFMGMGLVLSMFSAVMCLVLKIFARARYVRSRGYANAAIPPPLTVSETYAAFALASQSGSISPKSDRYQPHRRSSSRRTSSASYRTNSNSRYPSMVSLRSGELLRSSSYIKTGKYSVRSGSRYTSMSSLRSGELLRSSSYVRTGSRRLSISSLRSGSFAIVEPRGPDSKEHYLVYIRAPNKSLASATSSTSCESVRGVRQSSTEQLLAIYHTLPEGSSVEMTRGSMTPSGSTSGGYTKTGILRLPSAGPSESLRSMSTEDVFLEEQEDEVEAEDQAVLLEEDEETEEEEEDKNEVDTKLVKFNT